MIQGWVQLFLQPLVKYHVLPHLGIIEIMSLRRAVPSLDLDIFQLFCDRLADWMAKQQFPDAYIGHLMQQLRDPRSSLHLTGSLPLKILLGEEWQVGDLDFITTQWSGSMEHQLYHRWGLTYLQQRLVPHQVEDSKLYKHSWILEQVITRYQANNGYKIQFLVVEKDNIDKYLDTFDFDFCKNVIGNGKLKVKHPWSILHKRMIRPVLISSYFHKTFEEPLFLYHTYLPKRFMRLKTYQDRGFDFRLQMGHIEGYSHTNDFFKGQILAYWEMFWTWCITRDGKFIGSKMPEWKL